MTVPRLVPWAGVLATLCLFPFAAPAQVKAAPLNLHSVEPSVRIGRAVDDAARVLRTGNRHPLARPEFDAGPAEPEQRMERMTLLLRPDSAQERALEALLEAQQDPASPYYQRWLTPEEFGRLFGVSDQDVHQVVNWLESKGFEVEPVAESRRLVVFSGTAGQVEAAFHAGMRNYRVNGRLYHANAADPEIPEALAEVVAGVVSLHDFESQPQHQLLPADEPAAPLYTSGSTHYVTPGDFAAIYNLNPLYGSSTDASGQSIAVLGRTNIKLADVQTFRSRFGLTANDPVIVVNGKDPGILGSGELGEALLDVEWAGAVARNAKIQFVVSASGSSDGVVLSAQYAVNRNVAPIVSLSFGSCEAAQGATGNQFWNALWQQAAAQGMSVLVASGDSGAAGCDSPSSSKAASGPGVNALCSTPYSTCVGGTGFNDASNPGQYWAASNAAGTGASALGYIPETVWNESGSAGGSGLWSSGGGASAIYAKPSWQAGPGVPADGHRDVPDVALAAAAHNGFLMAMNGAYYSVSGTSVATPCFAGLMALVAQRQGAPQGNANPALYGIAARQSAGSAPVFHDITAGSNAVAGASGFAASPGFDLATGWGSVDANALVNGWRGAVVPSPSFQLSAASLAPSLVQGTSAAIVLTTAVSGGFKSAIALSTGTPPAGLTAAVSPAAIASPGAGSSTLTLTAGAQAAPGSYRLAVTAAGGGITQSLQFTVTVTARCVATLAPASGTANATAGSGTVGVTVAQGCPWTAASNAPWLTVTAGASGSGNGTVGYSVAANTAASSRSGTISIGGQTFTLSQAAVAPAAFGLSPTAASFDAGGGKGTAVLTAPSAASAWSVTSSVNWIAITSPVSGKGNQTIVYTVASNPSGGPRTGKLQVAGLSLAVSQAGPACTFQVSVGPLASTKAGWTGNIAVAAPAACSWTAQSTVDWITITAGAQGAGNGTASYRIAVGTTPGTRTGQIKVAGYVITITQKTNANAAAQPLLSGIEPVPPPPDGPFD